MILKKKKNMATKLFGLESREYEFPLDRKALMTLTALPGFDKIINAFLNWTWVKWELIEMKGSNFHVTKQSCPELYNQVLDACHALNLTDFPQIYTKWGYYVNAYTMGYKETTSLVLFSGAIDLLDKDELNFIIGHELGHIKSNHCLYHNMALKISQFISDVPIIGDLMGTVRYFLMYWYRMSEFTADRAGLLACQNEEAVLNSIIKMAGVPQKYYQSIDRNAILEQAREFEALLSGDEQIMKNLSILDDTHPWTILRAAELIKWIDSGEYEKIINTHKGKCCTTCNKQVPSNVEHCPYCQGDEFQPL